MCGIIGYVGNRKASEIITEGLRSLEYRGYDSVGIAINNAKAGTIDIRKEKGMVDEVATSLQFIDMDGSTGIGHTRWATHGAPCKDNAHPHSDCSNGVVLVHNGVVENYRELKETLVRKGHKFSSETDSEVIAHQIEQYMKDGLSPFISFIRTVEMLKGSYAVVALLKGEHRIYVARKNSPLILGVGKGETFCASDIPAILKHTKTFVPLEEGDIAILSPEGYKVYDNFGNEHERGTVKVNWDVATAERGGYPHFMLKEINDQVHFIHESLASETEDAKKLLDNAKNVHVVACGTSFHAGYVLKILLQKYLNKNAEAYIASEYPFVSHPSADALIIAISQSGETADTLQALRYAKRTKGVKILALTNVVQSSITRLADEVVYLNAGPEVSVAATKTFVSQLAVIYKMLFGDDQKFNIHLIPKLFEQSMRSEPQIKLIAERIKDKKDVFFIGRGLSYPIAMEGALKLKEISYIHAEAYPGGELKHGPISLIEKGVPVIALAPKDEAHAKMQGNVKEVKARGAHVISLTDSRDIKAEADETIEIPAVSDERLYPFSLILPLQLIAYHTSVLRGINPDRPRNLAKSVTVE
jgi:glucosamine--fructose-6-phosphate aminotransferase (isomerizing)